MKRTGTSTDAAVISCGGCHSSCRRSSVPATIVGAAVAACCCAAAAPQADHNTVLRSILV
jgi:hypothetical protein